MQTFDFEGVTYVFAAVRCYDTNGLILLPDGRLLRVGGGWLESLPPIPLGLVLMLVTPAVEVPK